MKKLVLMFVAIAAISFASCGNKTAPAVEPAEEDTAVVVEDSVAQDSVVSDSVAATSEAE